MKVKFLSSFDGRCIRANTGKQFGLFDAKLVLNQLRYTGVFETTRIRKLGFPTRLYMQDFINKYACTIYITNRKKMATDKGSAILGV